MRIRRLQRPTFRSHLVLPNTFASRFRRDIFYNDMLVRFLHSLMLLLLRGYSHHRNDLAVCTFSFIACTQPALTNYHTSHNIRTQPPHYVKYDVCDPQCRLRFAMKCEYVVKGNYTTLHTMSSMTFVIRSSDIVSLRNVHTPLTETHFSLSFCVTNHIRFPFPPRHILQ